MTDKTKKWIRVTRIFSAIVIWGIALYDVIALAIGGVEATVSRGALSWPPELVFAIGFLFGHLLWPQRVKEEEGKARG